MIQEALRIYFKFRNQLGICKTCLQGGRCCLYKILFDEGSAVNRNIPLKGMHTDLFTFLLNCRTGIEKCDLRILRHNMFTYLL